MSTSAVDDQFGDCSSLDPSTTSYVVSSLASIMMMRSQECWFMSHHVPAIIHIVNDPYNTI